MRGDRVVVDEGRQDGVVERGELLDLMRCSEPVKKMQEWHSALNGAEVGDASEVHDLLNAPAREHCESGLPACIHILMITEN